MCCQLTWWRALGITAQQRPASKKVRTSVPPPAVLQIWATGICKFNLIFFILLSLWTWKQRDLSRILSAYASASCSEIHSMVPNIYQKTALEGKKKKKKLAAPNVLPPSTGRHTQLRKRQNIPIIPHLFWRQEVNLYGNIMSHDRSPRWQQWGEGT